MQTTTPTPQKNNWLHVTWFLGLAFSFTWLADLALYLNGGLTHPAASLLLLIVNVIGLILLVVLRLVGGKDAFAGAGLAGGKLRVWLLYGLGLVAFYGLQTFAQL